MLGSANGDVQAKDLAQLAIQLGRPANALAPFKDLTPEQIGTLSVAFDAAAVHQRELLDQTGPRVLRPLFRLVFRWLRR